MEVELHRELGRGALWIVGAQALDRRRITVRNRYNARLFRLQIDLKCQFVILVVVV